MLDSYIILNRKSKFIMKFFIVNGLILLLLVMIGMNTIYYKIYYQFHSKIFYFNSLYYFEVLIPESEVLNITSQKEVIIDSKVYYYQVLKVDSSIIYQDDVNYQKVYLKVEHLDSKYQKNGYELDIKILKDKKKIIDYLKE